MPKQRMRDVVLRAALRDCCNGLVRVVDDIQRFGFELRTLVLARGDDDAAVATIVVSIPSEADADLLVMRLGRHPSVASVAIERDFGAAQSLLDVSLLQAPVDRGLAAEPVGSLM